MDWYSCCRAPRRRRERWAENLFEESVPENFLTHGTKQNSRSRNLRVPKKMNPKKTLTKTHIIKMSKLKMKILQEARKSNLLQTRKSIRSSDFSAETLNISSHSLWPAKCWKKNPSIKNPLLGKVVIQNWRGESFPVKQQLKEFIKTKPDLQKMLKGLSQAEIKGHPLVMGKCESTNPMGKGKYTVKSRSAWLAQ